MMMMMMMFQTNLTVQIQHVVNPNQNTNDEQNHTTNSVRTKGCSSYTSSHSDTATFQ
jgi:hypothetical protein